MPPKSKDHPALDPAQRGAPAGTRRCKTLRSETWHTGSASLMHPLTPTSRNGHPEGASRHYPAVTFAGAELLSPATTALGWPRCRRGIQGHRRW